MLQRQCRAIVDPFFIFKIFTNTCVSVVVEYTDMVYALSLTTQTRGRISCSHRVCVVNDYADTMSAQLLTTLNRDYGDIVSAQLWTTRTHVYVVADYIDTMSAQSMITPTLMVKYLTFESLKCRQ